MEFDLSRNRYFVNETIQNCSFDRFRLPSRYFEKITFQDCSFTNFTFLGCHFDDCNFVNCSFESFALHYSFFSCCSFNECHFIELAITNSSFIQCDFSHIDGNYSFFSKTSFIQCKEENCSLIFAQMIDCFGLSKTCPEKGSFIGFKQLQHGIIAELEIPADAHRTSGFSRKCRADKAIVLGFYNKKGEPLPDLIHERAIYDGNFVYTRGQTVYADNFILKRETCAPGIHFFLTFQEAVDYIQ